MIQVHEGLKKVYGNLPRNKEIKCLKGRVAQYDENLRY